MILKCHKKNILNEMLVDTIDYEMSSHIVILIKKTDKMIIDNYKMSTLNPLYHSLSTLVMISL